ncbi:MAG: hypothetical protein AAB225_14610 [Acidobacteriota bacterium]
MTRLINGSRKASKGLKTTHPSRDRFLSNEVWLWLTVMAYDLGCLEVCCCAGSTRCPCRPDRAAAVCSGCGKPAPGYDHLPERRFEFIPFWGFLVFFLYRMRRVHGRNCGLVVEEVPWGDGKHQLTRAYMLFLARWARKVSWKEAAEAFRTCWEKVCDAVEYVVTWGLEHRTPEPLRATVTNHRILSGLLRPHRRETRFSDRVR